MSSRLAMVFWVVMLGSAGATIAAAAEKGCSGPGYLVALEADPVSVPAGEGHVVLSSPALHVYEGTGWTRLSATRWNCVEAAEAAMPKDLTNSKAGLPSYTVFRETDLSARPPKSDRVPQGCTRKAYFIGMYTITDPEQFAKYRQALAASGLAGSFGMTILFGDSKPVAVSGGRWPDNVTFNLTRWPCTAAFEAFFLGPEFQDGFLPIRKAAASYKLASFEPVY